ncbi:MAG: NADH-ubiquinone oxidoreductase-F iron-sulfur binding region domain-containing protein [Jatrophihabitantaceae bacterium]
MTRTVPIRTPLLEAVASVGGFVLGAVGRAERESLTQYRATGGYRPLPAPARIRLAARHAELRGAGGAGFPTATKLDSVAAGDGPRVVVANGEEGEPSSVKDRWLLRHRPHLVLDGLRTAAHAVQADEVYVYVSDAAGAAAVRAAQQELSVAALPELSELRIVEVEAAYVAGEETAVVRAIGGDEAKPLPKPPRPYEKGVGGRPTLVGNVESLARLGLALRPDVAARAGATILATVVSGNRAGLYEIAAGSTIADLLTLTRGASAGPPRAVLLGGFAGGIWGPDVLDAPLSHDGLRARGALLGCGSVITVEADDCPVAAAADVVSYLNASSSGQCGSCVRGTEVLAQELIKLARGRGTEDGLAQLQRRAEGLPGRGNCGLPDAAALLVRTLRRNFSGAIRSHLAAPCVVCQELVAPAASLNTRFRVRLDD